MSQIAFYRQARVDGGVRTGVDVDDVTALQLFEPGDDEPDPSLLWYVDVVVAGSQLPAEPEEVRSFLKGNGVQIASALKDFASDLGAGVDPDIWPASKEWTEVLPDMILTVKCSAVRRVASRELARHVMEVGHRWVDLLDTLHPATHATAR